jgi:hypothetical protein
MRMKTAACRRIGKARGDPQPNLAIRFYDHVLHFVLSVFIRVHRRLGRLVPQFRLADPLEALG